MMHDFKKLPGNRWSPRKSHYDASAWLKFRWRLHVDVPSMLMMYI